MDEVATLLDDLSSSLSLVVERTETFRYVPFSQLRGRGLLVEGDELVQFDGDAAVGILRTHRVHIAHHGNAVTVIEIIVAVGARDAPRQ
jgi:hypothetical protein